MQYEYVQCPKCGITNKVSLDSSDGVSVCGYCRSRLFPEQDTYFKEVDIEQGTSLWHQWRKEGIGASDAPIIMGVSPWMDLNKLIQIKIGKAEQNFTSYPMHRGKLLEPTARELYIEQVSIDVYPACLQSLEYEWMRASVDGICIENNCVVEIKCPGSEDHSLAIRGKIPKHYYPQLQHILAVTGFSDIDYWSYRDDMGILLNVPRDDDYIIELVTRENKVWKDIISKRSGRWK